VTHDKAVLREPMRIEPDGGITFKAEQVHCDRHEEFETGCPECIYDLGKATKEWRFANARTPR
jgi:hypothetical protein